MNAAQTEPGYVLGHSDTELERLERQAAFVADLTEDVLRRAGVGPGLRVLDIGCGRGDVSLIAAKLVGPTGRVLGVDIEDAGFAQARDRIAAAGLHNVRFAKADLREFDPAERFDALIGRFVLMHLPDPIGALRMLLRHVEPGGIVAFQEIAMSYAGSVPPVAPVTDNIARLQAAFARVGLHPDMGTALDRAFREVGLVPDLIGGVRMGGHGNGFVPAWLAQTVRSLLPLMERTGVATAADIDIDTLEERIRAATRDARALMLGPLLVGAWARVGADSRGA